MKKKQKTNKLLQWSLKCNEGQNGIIIIIRKSLKENRKKPKYKKLRERYKGRSEKVFQVF